MGNIGTATLEIQANTEQFEEQIGKVEGLLKGIPSRVLMDYCWLKPWTLIRAGWWLACGASLYAALAISVCWVLGTIFDWH